MISAPIGRQRITAPGTTGTWPTTMTSHGIAVLGERLRDEAVVARVEHRGVQEAVDVQRARLLVELVLDRDAALRDLDDRVDVPGRGDAERNLAQLHAGSAEARDEADHEAAADVDDQRPPRELRAEQSRQRLGEEVAADAAERAADRDPQGRHTANDTRSAAGRGAAGRARRTQAW